ncbi:MAG: hypothetical protein ACREFP_18690 [Acetobacteraceae bacterium]
MKVSILGAAVAMLLTAPAIAMAQTSRADSQSGAAANSASASFAATGSSNASVTQIYNMDPPADPAGGSASQGGDPTLNDNVSYGGAYTIHNTPDVIPPSWGGQNTCAVGASGGVAVAGFGVSFGGMWSDSGCERRNSAVVLYQMGEHKAAVALMCQDRHVAEAMQAAGDPCPGATPAVSRAAPPRAAWRAARVPPAAPAGARAVAASGSVTPPETSCRMVFHYPTFADGRRNPDGAGWMERECG